MSPRRIVAPAAFAARVAVNACSSDSTAHGPAMIVNESRPTGVVPTFTVVVSGCRSRATILYGLPTWITWSTPGICLNGIVWNRPVSPDQPDDRVDRPTRDECLTPRGAHLLRDGLDVRVRRVLFHHDDHVAPRLSWHIPGPRGTQG